MTWQNLYAHAALMKGSSTIVGVGGLTGKGLEAVLQNADVTTNPGGAQDYSIIVDDNDQYGEDWASVARGDGIYAHVVWLKEVTNTPTSPDLVNIEYWVLFGLNVGYVPAEDHKGDVIGVEIVYDHATDKIIRAAFSEHGKTLIMFDLAHSKPSTGHTITGKSVTGQHISENACEVEAQDHGYYDGGLAGGPGIFTGGDHHVFFIPDPLTHRCEHLAVYIEHGSHEPWPNQSGYYIGVADHNGNDVSFLPTTVHVLGSGDEPFVKFGGKFGDPTGPMRHRMWLGYIQAASPTDPDPYVDHDPLKWLPKLP